MENQQDPNRIAEEAVGQRHDGAPPDDVKEREGMSPEEAARQTAWSVGPQASVPEKTAESVGERWGNAYSDPGGAAHTRESNRGLKGSGASGSQSGGAARPVSAAWRQLTGIVSRQFRQQAFLMTVASFAMGYLTAALINGRNNAHIGMMRGPFQITTPPQGSGHPRGFVESTVLKTLTEHPQGMTAAEMIKELDPQHIDQRSIASALAALVRAKKVSLQERGNYISTAAEVPTAPDQPSA